MLFVPIGPCQIRLCRMTDKGTIGNKMIDLVKSREVGRAVEYNGLKN
jgi:hypothetical protein